MKPFLVFPILSWIYTSDITTLAAIKRQENCQKKKSKKSNDPRVTIISSSIPKVNIPENMQVIKSTQQSWHNPSG